MSKRQSFWFLFWALLPFLIIVILFALKQPANATTCSQANSECESKGLENVIIGTPSDAASEAKGLVNVITNNGNVSNSKLLINVIVIPGPASGGIIPAFPLTHFR